MIIETYDYYTGNISKSGVSILSLGDITQGRHSDIPALFRCLKSDETTINSITISLENPGLSGNTYKIFTNPTFISNLSTGSYNFTVLSTTPFPIPITGNASNYVWIDIFASTTSDGPAKPRLLLSIDYD